MSLLTPEPSWPDEDLVRECLNGNEAAWVALVDKYKKLVYSMPVKYQLPPEEAADIFQHVWTDLYRDLPRLERVEGLRAWLITASARRCLLHKKRRQKVLTMTGLDSDDMTQLTDGKPDAAQIHAEAEKEHRIRLAVETLPPRCRNLVQMLFFEHPPRPYSQVARELGLAEGSIGFIRGRCLQKLKSLLEELDVR
jgi:RNA polymerase sigma factor (sigma-70 family)